MLRNLTLALAVLAPLAAACGGEDENILPGDAGPDTDAAVDADTTPRPTAVVVTGDFSVTGIFSTIDVLDREVTSNVLAGVAGGEPWVRKFGNELFIVNRFMGNNVTIVATGPYRFVDQFGTGVGTNPQDVAVVGDKLYVPILDGAGLKVINRTTRAVTTVSLASFDPDDNVPNCVSAAAVGTRVFVVCGIYDASFTARGPGKVAVIDSATDTVITSFDLTYRNPFGRIIATPASSMFGGDLLINTSPAIPADTTQGCLERISTGDQPAANGCAATNTALTGYVSGGESAVDGSRLWVAVTALNPDWSTNFARLRSIDLTTGEVGAFITPTSVQIGGAATCPGGRVLAADITFGAAGVRIFEGDTEITTEPLDVGRPVNAPNGIACY